MVEATAAGVNRMSMVRRLTSPVIALALCGAAAHAEDQLIKDEPAEADVRICEAYGPGYQLVPGTSTCIKIQGMVRMDVQATSGGNAPKPPAASGDH
jgi:hypothetical protein